MKRKSLFNIICFTLVILLLTINSHALASSVINVSSITLNKNQAVLSIGEIDKLTAIVNPTNATNQNVTWSSSNPDIVNVINGTIQALKQGGAIIIATSNADESIKAFCTVMVNNSKTTVTLDKTSDTISVGGTDTLTATVLPPSSTNNTVVWTSSDPSTVNVINGRIIGMKPGAAVVTVSTPNGNSMASCYIQVTTAVTAMVLSKAETALKVGGTDTLVALLMPSTVSNITVNWSSSDSSIVEVHNGILIGLKEGIATITAATADGKVSATCAVTVGNPTIYTTSITLNKTSSALLVGGTDTLTASILPVKATNKNVNWYSSDTNVVVVDNGRLIAVGAGRAAIIANSADGHSSAACNVTVTSSAPAVIPVNNIRLGGLDRYETAVAISKQGWKGTSNYAIIATAQAYPDALSAAPLAKKYSAPILLTDKTSIPQSVLAEIKRLNVKNVFIVGGTGVVSQAVENQLKALNIAVDRLGGADRYETAIKIAERVGTAAGKLMIANGYKWEEALSASATAAKAGVPIILTDKDNLPASVKSFISKNSFSKSYILGDTDLISDNVANNFSGKERIVGSNSYERNINVLKKFESDIDFTNICVSTGKDFPDALTGSALAASLSSGVILVDSNNVNSTTVQYITQKLPQVKNVYIFGGQGALSDTVINTLFKK